MGSFKQLAQVAVMTGVLGWLSTGLAQRQIPLRAQAPAPPDAKTNGDDDEPELSDGAQLALIVSLVEAAQYERCVEELDRLLDPKSERPLTDPEVVESARLYKATCYIGLGKPELADEPLREAIRANPQMRRPDSLLFPQRVIERFIQVQESMYAELRAAEQAAIERAKREAAERQRGDNERWARMLMLERLARQQVVIVENRRWVAAVPFGVGQFQNGNAALGWLFLGTEAVLGITALTSLAVHTNLQNEVDAAKERGADFDEEVNQRLDDWHLALRLSSYGFLAATLLGVAEAQLSFVPEVRTVRERPLPKSPGLSVEPQVSGGPGRVELGVAGRF